MGPKQILFSLLLIASGFAGFSQSPYLSVKATIVQPLNSMNYKIEMKICNPKNKSSYKDYFGHDTSSIDWARLQADDFACGEFFETQNENKKPEEQYNRFSFGNQIYAYESILVLRIFNVSYRNYHPPMFIVLPVKYQSFVTFIELTDIPVRERKIIYLNNLPDTRDERGYLSIKQSLLNYPAMDKEKFPLKLYLNK